MPRVGWSTRVTRSAVRARSAADAREMAQRLGAKVEQQEEQLAEVGAHTMLVDEARQRLLAKWENQRLVWQGRAKHWADCNDILKKELGQSQVGWANTAAGGS